MTDLPQTPIPTEPSGAQSPNSPDQSFTDRHGISPVVFALVALAIVFVSYQVIGGLISYFLFGLNPTSDQTLGLRLMTGFGEVLLILVPTLLLVRLCSRTPGRFLRMEFPDIRVLLLPLLGIFSLQQMLQVYIVFQDKIPLPSELEELVRQLKDAIEQLTAILASSSSVPELMWVIIVVALIPAISEEFLFRGVVQRSFEKQLGPSRAMIVTGLIFGAYHLNPFSFVPLAALGIYLSFLAMRTGSLWTSIFAHFYNNAYACVMLFLKMDDNIVGAGNPEKMTTGALLLIFWFFGVLFIVSNLYLLKITRISSEPLSSDHSVND